VLRSAWPDADMALAAKSARDVQELVSESEKSTS